MSADVCVGTTARALVIREVIETFLRPLDDGLGQIVVYGAGFDTNYFRLQAKQTSALRAYYEIDFSSVVAVKTRIIERTAELNSLVPNATYLRTRSLISYYPCHGMLTVR